MTTRKPAAPTPEVHNTGAHVEGCHIENKAAPVSNKAAEALAELARASAEHARAITAIANALKGSEAHMGTGISLSDIRGS